VDLQGLFLTWTLLMIRGLAKEFTELQALVTTLIKGYRDENAVIFVA
jgi:hypothetical protein